MTHRAQQIADAVVGKLSARAALKASVYSQRALTLGAADQELPAACVMLGDDDPLSDDGASNFAYLDSTLALTVALVATADDEDELVRELSRLRAETHIALMADRTQGLSWVMNTRYAGASAPDLNTDGGSFAGRIETRWLVHYRMSVTDPNN